MKYISSLMQAALLQCYCRADIAFWSLNSQGEGKKLTDLGDIFSFDLEDK